jgi:hypothetical protein
VQEYQVPPGAEVAAVRYSPKNRAQ